VLLQLVLLQLVLLVLLQLHLQPLKVLRYQLAARMGKVGARL